MQIRKLEKTEQGKSRELYETVFFEDEASFVDYYYEEKTAENEIYAAEDVAGIHGMLHLNPYTVCWHGKKEYIHYIVAVATRREYRHQGIMRRLLQASLEEMYDREEPFVFLMPASEAIYSPFGFRRAWPWRWEEEAVREENAQQSAKAASECGDEVLRELSDHVNAVLDSQFELFTWRTLEYYRRLSREQDASGGRLEVLFENGKPVSARCSARETFPPMMTRIVNLEQFIARVRAKEEQRFYWKVTDRILPGNEGTFEVTVTPEGGKLRRISGGEVENLDISQIPERLGENNPFLRAMICEVV